MFLTSVVSEIVAKPKYSCPSCGAEAQWNAAKQALVCPFCGTVSPAKIDTAGVIEEHDLVTALRGIPDDQRGWQAEKVSVKCQSCQAITVFDAARVGQRCDFCGSTALIPVDQMKAPIRPESLLAFKLAESAVRDKIREWYGSRWFAPNRMKSAALTDTVKGFYLPYWTFDAQVAADWTAESGYYYYETEFYTDNNGHQASRQVQRTRWEPSSGHVDHFFDDELVSGSVGVNAKLMRKIEPFPTHELVPYDSGYLAGWVVEQYQIDLVTAATAARAQMEDEITKMCAHEVHRRHVHEPAGERRLFGADIQAHPHAGLDARIQLRWAEFPGCGQRLYTGTVAAITQELGQNLAGGVCRAGAHSHHCNGHRQNSQH